jgi:hypothetical protein
VTGNLTLFLARSGQRGQRYAGALLGNPGSGRRARGELRAPGVEPAAGRDPRRVGRLTGENDRLDRRLGQHRHQRPGVRVAGVREHLLRGSHLDDPPEVHDGEAVGDVPGQAEIVSDHQSGQSELIAQPQQQREDLASYRRVERGHWLVGDEHARLEHQRPRDDDPLALPAGQLMRVALEEPLWRSHTAPAEGVGDPGLLVVEAVDSHPLGDSLVDGVPRVQRSGRVLQDKLDAAPVTA